MDFGAQRLAQCTGSTLAEAYSAWHWPWRYSPRSVHAPSIRQATLSWVSGDAVPGAGASKAMSAKEVRTPASWHCPKWNVALLALVAKGPAWFVRHVSWLVIAGDDLRTNGARALRSWLSLKILYLVELLST